MEYKLVASSRSRATETYQNAEGVLLEVMYYKSGRWQWQRVPAISKELTVRYSGEAQEQWDGPEPPEQCYQPVVEPAQVG